MSESTWRTDVVKGLADLDAHAVENPALPGTPDVNYVEGWLELKWSRSWPAKPATIVPCKHYSPQQRIYHRKRWAAGGRIYLLWKVADTWMLFEGNDAAQHVGKADRNTLRYATCWSHKGPGAMERLLHYLSPTSDCP